MTQVAVAADSIGMTIPLHNPNENDLVCQGQFTRENLRISGDRKRIAFVMSVVGGSGWKALMRQAQNKTGIDPRAARGRAVQRLLGEVRRFIEAAVLEQGCRASELAAFWAVASDVNRALHRAANSS
jgi:hypothetical protein